MVTRKTNNEPGVCLLTPPFAPPMIPNLAVPTLAGYLHAHGIEVEQIDLNICFHDDIVNDTGLFDAVLELLETKLRTMDDRSSLTRDEAGAYLARLIQVCRTSVLKKRSSKIVKNLRLSIPHLEPLPFGYPSQKDAFQMVRQTMSLMDIRSMELGANVGAAQTGIPEYSLPLLNGFYERHLSHISLYKKQIFGISLLYDSQIYCAIVLADCLRRLFPSALLVVGGSYVRRIQTDRNLDLLKSKFNVIVIGEGEEHLLQICRNFYKKKLTDSNSPLLLSTPLPVMQLQTPVFDSYQLAKYWSQPLTLMIQASRGCYWNQCAFCSYRECYSGAVRTMVANAAVDMLQALQRAHKCNHFEFVDDCLSPDFITGLVAELEKREMNIQWSACVRFDRGFDAGLIAKMSENGCRRLTFGMESASQRILDYVNKGTQVADYLPVLKACKTSSIAVHLNWIAGLPGETQEELYRTVDFLKENIDYYAYQFGQVFTLEAASRFAIQPELFDLPHNNGQRAFHDPESRKQLYEIIHTLPIEGKSFVPRPDPLDHKTNDTITGWSPFVARQPVHYDLIELGDCVTSKKNQAIRQPEQSWILYHTRSGRHMQIPDILFSEIEQQAASNLEKAPSTKTLRILYENDFIS